MLSYRLFSSFSFLFSFFGLLLVFRGVIQFIFTLCRILKLILVLTYCDICYQVKVNTVLGSHAPPLTVTLVRAFSSSARDNSIIENQVLKCPCLGFLLGEFHFHCLSFSLLD